MSKSAWLQEVEDDAVRIQNRRFNEFFEEQQYQKEKAEKANVKQAVKAELPVGGEVYEPTAKKGSK